MKLQNTSFRDIVGQKHACEILSSALETGRVPHAYLFVGQDGVGKRQTVLQWAKVLNCPNLKSSLEACESCSTCKRIQLGNYPDVLMVNFDFQARILNEAPEKQQALKIKTVREMEKILLLKSVEGRSKVAVLEFSEKLVEVAAHALLKILEEPPPKTHLVLIANDAFQLLATIRSRCQRVQFRPLPVDLIVEKLLETNNTLPREKAEVLARQSEGSLSRALSGLEEGEGIDFNWEAAPLSELLAWCERFRGKKAGRDDAKAYLKRLLAKFQSGQQVEPSQYDKIMCVLEALESIQRNVSPRLVMEVLLLKLRRKNKIKLSVL